MTINNDTSILINVKSINKPKLVNNPVYKSRMLEYDIFVVIQDK